MEKNVKIYRREDTYRGRFEINHYNMPTELRCYIEDNSDLRDMGVLVNGEEPKDTYNVKTINYKGHTLHNYKFDTPEEANECFKAITSKFKSFKKVD